MSATPTLRLQVLVAREIERLGGVNRLAHLINEANTQAGSRLKVDRRTLLKIRDIPAKVSLTLKPLTAQFLRDQSVTIDDRFVVVGRDDRTNPDRHSIEQLMQGVNRQLPVILLDHQPYHLSESQQNKIDLQISGHTHRGQIFPFNLLVDRMFELAHGYRKIGHTHFYVSSGLGLWAAPLRIGTQSEIVNVVIRH